MAKKYQPLNSNQDIARGIANGAGGGGGKGGGVPVMSMQESAAERELKRMQKAADLRPKAPVWEKIAGNPTADLEKQKLTLAQRMDPRIMQTMSEQAFATGPSAWRNLAGQQQGQQYAALGDQLRGQAAGAQAQAQSQAAMRGGLGGGSAERLAMQAQQNQLMGQQGLARQRQGETVGLDLQDQARKDQAFQQYGNAQSQMNQYDIGNALGEMQQRRGFELQKYSDAMKEWGALQTAKATPKGGKK
jgi:hypothetical protein